MKSIFTSVALFVLCRYLTDLDTNKMINEFMDNMTYTDILNEAFRFNEREVSKEMGVFVMSSYVPTQVMRDLILCVYFSHVCSLIQSKNWALCCLLLYSKEHLMSRKLRLMPVSLTIIMQTLMPNVKEIAPCVTTKAREKRNSLIIRQTSC